MKLLSLLAALASLYVPVPFQDQITEPATKTKFYSNLGSMDICGMAVRSRFWVKVYAIALYAETEPVMEKLGNTKPTSNALAYAVARSTGQKALVMHFVRDVSKDSIQGAFREGIEKTIKIDDSQIADDAKQFLDAMTDVKKEDWVELYFEKDGTVKLRGNGEEIVQVTNPRLHRAIIDIYLGTRPIDDGIKRDLVKLLESGD